MKVFLFFLFILFLGGLVFYRAKPKKRGWLLLFVCLAVTWAYYFMNRI